MRICVSLDKGGIEPITNCFDPEMLLKGRNIKDALKKLGITPKDFVHGTIIIHDKEEDIDVRIPLREYSEFERYAWYIRQKLRQKEKVKRAKKLFP